MKRNEKRTDMKKYYGLDLLRGLSCIGILAMHVAANGKYDIDGYLYERIIPSFTDLVFLFMAVSAFGVCCGYYEKVRSGDINWTDFYRKRYSRILPFFLLLILIDVAMNFDITVLSEGIAEATLLHGLIPHSYSVIGVSWFLGTVFVFYLAFPFFCVLIENKRRALCAFAASLVLNYICSSVFGLDRSNFVYSLCYFLAGGLVFLYRDKIAKLRWYVYLPITAASAALYYLAGASLLTRMLLTVSLLMTAVSADFKGSRLISFLSGISMEIYLCHMLVFRALERIGLSKLTNGMPGYLVCFALTLAGSVVFSFAFGLVLSRIQRMIGKRGEKNE